MNKKQVLLADADFTAAALFQEALGADWQVLAATNGAAALDVLDSTPCELVVAHLDLPGIDGAELLNRVRRKWPYAVRILSAREDDKQRVLKSARGAHQFLGKPYDPTNLKDAMERAMALEVWISDERVRESIAKIRTLPTIPTVYTELLAALRSREVTTEQVGGIIAKDMAMTAKMLQLLNSACFGLSREITDPAEAVGILGFETVKTMVMTIKLLNQYDKLKPTDFSIDRLWVHSTAVARTARELTLLETGSRGLADAAFTAGLLHDIGKVILASNFDGSYQGAIELGCRQNLPAWEVEKQVFGASHGEVGAYLLGLWGMPLPLLEATALHHHPSLSTNQSFTTLTAVHVANVLESELTPNPYDQAPPQLDMDYLAKLGLESRVTEWRAQFAARDAVVPDRSAAQPEPPPTPLVPPLAASHVAPAPTPNQARRASTGGAPVIPFKWLALSATVVVLLLLAWLAVQLPATKIKLSGKSPTATNPKPGSTASATTTSHTPDSGKAGEATAVKLREPETMVVKARELTVAPKPAASEPQAKPDAATDSTPKLAVVVPKIATPQDYKLQGIFFSEKDPSALINGKLLHLGQKFGGLQLVSITTSNVTIDVHDEQTVLKLH